MFKVEIEKNKKKRNSCDQDKLHIKYIEKKFKKSDSHKSNIKS